MKLETSTKDYGPQITLQTTILAGVVVLFLLTFLGWVVAYFIDHQRSYQELTNEIVRQNAKIELLYEDCRGEKAEVGRRSNIIAPQQISPDQSASASNK